MGQKITTYFFSFVAALLVLTMTVLAGGEASADARSSSTIVAKVSCDSEGVSTPFTFNGELTLTRNPNDASSYAATEFVQLNHPSAENPVFEASTLRLTIKKVGAGLFLDFYSLLITRGDVSVAESIFSCNAAQSNACPKLSKKSSFNILAREDGDGTQCNIANIRFVK